MKSKWMRRTMGVGLLGSCVMLLQACFQGTTTVVLLLVVIAAGLGSTSAKGGKLKEPLDVSVDATYGGLDGTFSIDVGDYGTLQGTADIKGQKKAQMKLKDDDQTASLVEAMILDRSGVQIDVTKSKTVFKGSQTTGGVKKKYKLVIKWKADVVTGPNAGKRAKGVIKTKGSFE